MYRIDCKETTVILYTWKFTHMFLVLFQISFVRANTVEIPAQSNSVVSVPIVKMYLQSLYCTAYCIYIAQCTWKAYTRIQVWFNFWLEAWQPWINPSVLFPLARRIVWRTWQRCAAGPPSSPPWTPGPGRPKYAALLPGYGKDFFCQSCIVARSR